jgi:hypothetical protein
MKVNSVIQKGTKADLALRDYILNSKAISDASGTSPALAKYEEYISNSYLAGLEHLLNGTQGFFGNEGFLKFGNELHKRFLEPHLKKEKLSPEDEVKLKGMLKALSQYEPLTSFMKGAKLETLSVKPVHGQLVKVKLDIKKRKKGRDIKSTSCTTREQALKAAVKYGYPKQAFLYMAAEELDDFDFDFVTKSKPHKTFTINIDDFSDLVQVNAADKTRDLIDVYKALRKYYVNQSY